MTAKNMAYFEQKISDVNQEWVRRWGSIIKDLVEEDQQLIWMDEYVENLEAAHEEMFNGAVEERNKMCIAIENALEKANTLQVQLCQGSEYIGYNNESTLQKDLSSLLEKIEKYVYVIYALYVTMN